MMNGSSWNTNFDSLSSARQASGYFGSGHASNSMEVSPFTLRVRLICLMLWTKCVSSFKSVMGNMDSPLFCIEKRAPGWTLSFNFVPLSAGGCSNCGRQNGYYLNCHYRE